MSDLTDPSGVAGFQSAPLRASNRSGEGALTQGESRKAFLVEGRVQGVGFRWWTKRTADELGLGGTVRNRRDGRVELHAAGSRKALEELARRLRRGPPAARVEGVQEVEPDGELPEAFRIVR